MEYRVSYFPNVSSKKTRDIDLLEIFEIIRTGTIKKHIEAIRNEQDDKMREDLKRHTPAITLSGIFRERHAARDFVNHSGLIQVDFDKVSSPADTKVILCKDIYSFGCFISPSGTGVKAIVKITPDKNLHENTFDCLSKYYFDTYGFEMDKKCRDVSRLCFLSYDSDLFVNEKAKLFIGNTSPAASQLKNLPGSVKQPSDFRDDVEKLVAQIEACRTDITAEYDHWLKLGFAFADGFGINGLTFYHRLSRFYPGYNQSACEKQFHYCLNGNRKGITIKTFFQIAKEFGFTLKGGHSANTRGSTSEKRNEKDEIRSESKEEVFYSPVYGKDNEGNSVIVDIKFNYRKFIDLLYSFGFRRFDIDKQYIFVRVEKQIVSEVTPIQIQDYFISWIKTLPQKLEYEVNRNFLIEKIYKSPATYFCENKLSLLKSESEITFNADTKTEGFVYYKNGFVICSGEGYSLQDYSCLKKHVWRTQILPRVFTYKEIEGHEIQSSGVFARFVFNVANKDIKRFTELCTILGYNLHSYYDRKLKATILTDSRISDKPDGRTGKTLLCKGLGNIKNYCEINGKDFDASNKHKYELASLDTQIICLNDVRKNFDFESLYNDITEHLTVNRKNQQPFNIRTKILVTTNKTVSTEGDSSKDRCIEFELSEHYSEKFGPMHEFGHWFFSDWDESEWIEFDNFMMYCICQFLKNGIIESPPINLNRRKIIDNTCPEFVEFMNEKIKEKLIEVDTEYNKKSIYNLFIEEYPDLVEHRYLGKQSTFSKFLKIFCKYSNDLDDELIERKSMATRYFMFKSKDPNEKK